MSKLRNSNILWFSVSTVILFLLVYFADYREIISVLRNASPFFVILSVFSGLFTLLMWGLVWHRFFDILDIPVNLKKSIRLLLAGLFLNAMTPLGKFGGEPFVAHLIGRRTDSNYQQALSSLSSADLSNAIPFATFGIASIGYLAIFSTLEGLLADLAIIMVSLAVSAVIIIYLLWFNGARRLVGVLNRIYVLEIDYGRWQPYIDSGKERGREILDRLEEVREQPRQVIIALCISHLAVMGHIGATYFGLMAVGASPELHTVFLIVSLSSIFTFSPTPGSAGTIEAGLVILLLAFYPISIATATSVAIIYRVATYLPGVIFGYMSFVSLNRD
jgi:uncharacterized protein (TIRG00374 family)